MSFLCASSSAQAPSGLPDSVARIKPSIVGVGTYQKTRNPSAVFSGTGFVVADGRHVVTNAHVLPRETNTAQHETLIVLVGGADEANARAANVVAVDRAHDLALLRISGEPLPALRIGDSETVREGQQLAFTGFPIGMALGLYPATHRATLAALVPIARAGVTARQLNPKMIKRLRDSAYVVFQLDATAYPGNSGSPLFDPATAEVYGIINSVYIQGTREQVITRPSGITYAIPSIHISNLLEQSNLAASP
ncbi:MAG: trypsin-like serine protease [Betaproteobacteria bacterium]|nr:trypsin-like serine protease [Betaproteobacteria bacterium]